MSSEVRRFARAALPFTALLVALYAALHATASAVAPRFEDKVLRFEKLQERAPRIGALFVGNSLCCAADFDALGMPGFELRHPGSDLYEAAYVLRRAVPLLPNLKVVVVPFGYSALHWDNSLRPEMRAELYATYKVFEPIGGRRDGIVDGFFAPTVRPDHFEELYRRLRGTSEPTVEVDDWGRPITEAVEVVRTPALLEEQSRLAIVRHLDIVADVDAARPHAAADAQAELAALAEMLAARDVELFLVIPTFHESFGRLIREEPSAVAMIDELRTAMTALEAEHANVHFLDASRHPVISRAPANFRSCDHLSRLGARRFSAELRGLMDRLMQTGG